MKTLLLFTVFGCAAFAGSADALAGSWQDGSTVWTIESAGDQLHVLQMDGTRKVEEFTCNTMGKECKAGKAKVSLWFSGPKLVMLETHGSEIVKRRFDAGGSDELVLETIPVTPTGKTETQRLKRTELSATAATGKTR